tara:strand:+ start:2058 stop:2366 length:309 start_codon:yes stop_codon:yes gene_type:complete
MKYYFRISPVDYELIDSDKFNKFLKKLLVHCLDNSEKHLELSILIQKFKQSFNDEEIPIFIYENNKYKLRNINTYIKGVYSSFQGFLEKNNIKCRPILCIDK